MTDRLRFVCLFAVLIAGGLGMRAMGHGRPVPPRESLSQMPVYLGGWLGQELPDLPVGQKGVLRADDYILREYVRSGLSLGLFIAYYRQQRSGDALHSPQNCLPGSGWEPVSSSVIRISLESPPGDSFKANDYIVSKDGDKGEVIYWYQSAGRRFASEYLGKMYLVWDGITENRTDGALIRITGPYAAGDAQTHQAMVQFAEELSRVLPNFLPN
jgi:EpsI family protein